MIKDFRFTISWDKLDDKTMMVLKAFPSTNEWKKYKPEDRAKALIRAGKKIKKILNKHYEEA